MAVVTRSQARRVATAATVASRRRPKFTSHELGLIRAGARANLFSRRELKRLIDALQPIIKLRIPPPFRPPFILRLKNPRFKARAAPEIEPEIKIEPEDETAIKIEPEDETVIKVEPDDETAIKVEPEAEMAVPPRLTLAPEPNIHYHGAIGPKLMGPCRRLVAGLSLGG